MGDVITLPVVRIERVDHHHDDGGKSRIRARRELIGLAKQGGPIIPDLVMHHADPESSLQLPCDC